MGNISTRYSSVSFGSSQGGLSTVGYTLKNFDGTTNTARSTTAVVEIGTSTGIYATSFNLDSDANVLVLWDTGAVSPKYAVDEKFSQLNSIQDSTDKIRTIWNTLMQMGNATSDLMVRLQKIEEKLGLSAEDIKNDLRATMSTVGGGISENSAKMYDSITTLNQKVEALAIGSKPLDYNKRFDEVLLKFNDIKPQPDKRVSIVQAKVNDTNRYIIDVNNGLTNISNKFDLINQYIDNKISGIGETLNSLTVIVNNLTTKQKQYNDNNDNTLNTVETTLSNINGNINRYIAVLNNLITETDNNTKNMTKFIPILESAYLKAGIVANDFEMSKKSNVNLPMLMALTASKRR